MKNLTLILLTAIFSTFAYAEIDAKQLMKKTSGELYIGHIDRVTFEPNYNSQGQHVFVFIQGAKYTTLPLIFSGNDTSLGLSLSSSIMKSILVDKNGSFTVWDNRFED